MSLALHDVFQLVTTLILSGSKYLMRIVFRGKKVLEPFGFGLSIGVSVAESFWKLAAEQLFVHGSDGPLG